jgi:hypothetical protein
LTTVGRWESSKVVLKGCLKAAWKAEKMALLMVYKKAVLLAWC